MTSVLQLEPRFRGASLIYRTLAPPLWWLLRSSPPGLANWIWRGPLCWTIALTTRLAASRSDP